MRYASKQGKSLNNKPILGDKCNLEGGYAVFPVMFERSVEII